MSAEPGDQGRPSALSLTEEADYYRGVAAYEEGDLAASRRYFEMVLKNVPEHSPTADSSRLTGT